MTSSRIEEVKSLEIDDFQVVDHVATQENIINRPMPPKARPLSYLLIGQNINNNTHPTYKAKKVLLRDGHPIGLKPASYFYKENNTKEVDKINEADPRIACLEAYACTISRFLATAAYVPTANAIYDESQRKFIGVASKEIPNFKSNSEDRLKESDITVETTTTAIEQQRAILDENIQELINSSKRESQGFLSFFYNKNQRQLTAAQFSQILIDFQQNSNKYSDEALTILQLKLQERANVIEANIKAGYTKPSYPRELSLLSKIINTAKTLKMFNAEKEDISVETLEALDQRLQDRKVQLDESKPGIINEVINGKKIVITTKSLLNYRIIKGLAIALTTRYIFKEDDNHSHNMSKYGHIIDFDMTKWNILYKFKKMKQLDQSLRQPLDTTYHFTERDIRNFPDLKDAKPYYWPTYQVMFTESVIKTINFFGYEVTDYAKTIAKNFFTLKDNEAYKKLSNNPIFKYHQFQTLLKFLLTNENMYRGFAELHIPANELSKSNDGKPNQTSLIDELVKDEAMRIAELYKVLRIMPEFKEFLLQHGDSAFAVIKKEFTLEKAKYAAKMKAKPYYQSLVDAIDLGAITASYREMKHELTVGHYKAEVVTNPIGVRRP